jgi:poly-gamma-glutamate synthesis protein (capsule biosynthesis protein)
MRARLFGVGDVFPNVADGAAAFRFLSPVLRRADLVVGNCEGVYSDAAAPVPSHKHASIAPRERGSMLGAAGFDVLGCANNHALDGGQAGLADTRAVLAAQQIATVGAGDDLDRALTPVVVERGGIRFAFLAFCSVFPAGYEARRGRPGIAPLRVRTFYAEPDRNFWEPGVPPLIFTEPVAEDLENCHRALARARAEADVVVALCHWGYSNWLETLQDYEVLLARDIADHGADIVLCCHHHSLRGVEVRNGRPIFYGLGTLVHHLSIPPSSAAEAARRRAAHGEKAHVSTAEFPLFPFHPDARMTGIASFDVDSAGVTAVGLIPAMIGADGATEPLAAGDPRAEQVAGYLERITRASGFTTAFSHGTWEGLMSIEIRQGT